MRFHVFCFQYFCSLKKKSSKVAKFTVMNHACVLYHLDTHQNTFRHNVFLWFVIIIIVVILVVIVVLTNVVFGAVVVIAAVTVATSAEHRFQIWVANAVGCCGRVMKKNIPEKGNYYNQHCFSHKSYKQHNICRHANIHGNKTAPAFTVPRGKGLSIRKDTRDPVFGARISYQG